MYVIPFNDPWGSVNFLERSPVHEMYFSSQMYT